MPKSHNQNLPWADIKALFVGGVPLTEITKHLDLTDKESKAVYRKSRKEDWGKFIKQTKALIPGKSLENLQLSKGNEPKNIAEIITDFYKETGITHRKNMIEIGMKQIEAVKSNPPPITDIDDLDKVAKILDRATGLENESEQKQSNCILNLQFLMQKPEERAIDV